MHLTTTCPTHEQLRPLLDRLPAPEAPRPPRRRTFAWLAAAAGAVLLLAAGTVLFLQAPHGTVRIEINDPDIKVGIDKGVFTITGAEKTDIRIAPGEHTLRVERGDLEFDTDRFTIKRGDRVFLKVELLDGKVQVVKDGKAIGATPPPTAIPAEWFKRVTALPARHQVDAVVAKLKERNPGFDGTATPIIEDGVVTGLDLLTDQVTDLAPLRALPGLRTLSCCGSKEGASRLADLAPLQGLKLVSLNCKNTAVSDLSPLRDRKLTTLNCWSTKVSDLAPLKGMSLTTLVCAGTKVADLAPLQGMPLESLWIAGTSVVDLSPLKGMNLRELSCSNTPVADLSPLKGMKLSYLDIGGTRVSDLAPLQGMPLKTLMIEGTPVTDLAPLRGMPLEDLSCDPRVAAEAAFLPASNTLKWINRKPVWGEFRKERNSSKRENP